MNWYLATGPLCTLYQFQLQTPLCRISLPLLLFIPFLHQSKFTIIIVPFISNWPKPLMPRSVPYVGGCWRSSRIRCRECTVGYAACNTSMHHKAVHQQQRHHRQPSKWQSDHNRLMGSGGSAAVSVMSSEAQNAHVACGTVGVVQ